jgi:2-oxo-hept-3-ene-1,7-dioate hydratase
MSVTLRNGAGEEVVTAPGKAVLGHPANAVLWLMSKGVVLKPGDLVSVGSFGPLTPSAKMQGGASVTYTGLPGNPSVSVTFSQ